MTFILFLNGNIPFRPEYHDIMLDLNMCLLILIFFEFNCSQTSILHAKTPALGLKLNSNAKLFEFNVSKFKQCTVPSYVLKKVALKVAFHN